MSLWCRNPWRFQNSAGSFEKSLAAQAEQRWNFPYKPTHRTGSPPIFKSRRGPRGRTRHSCHSQTCAVRQIVLDSSSTTKREYLMISSRRELLYDLMSQNESCTMFVKLYKWVMQFSPVDAQVGFNTRTLGRFPSAFGAGFCQPQGTTAPL